MLLSTKDLQMKKLEARDDEFGRLSDVYFDDTTWTVRYFVADTGTWLPDRLVLISPSSVRKAGVDGERIVVDLTREAIESSPPVTSARTLSRQMEEELATHYDWPRWWMSIAPGEALVGTRRVAQSSRPAGDTSAPAEHLAALRSASAVTAYDIRASDGDIGTVDDLLLDADDWTVRGLVVDTRKWLPGKKVVIPPKDITRVSWGERQVHVDRSREEIKASPEVADAVKSGDR